MRSQAFGTALCSTLLILAGCAAQHAPVSHGKGAWGGNAPRSASTSGESSPGPVAMSSAPSPAPAPTMEESRGAAPKSAMERERTEDAKQRPGLGTVFGETRTSHIRHRRFDRAASSPFASMTLYYNDSEGVAAQMTSRGGEGRSPYYATTPGGGITVALQDASGRVLPGRRASGRTYVVGREGDRYTIVIRNHTAGRYEIVASVDGLDVIDGRPASIVKRGYLLHPHASLVIDGWRRSDHAVAAFRFGRVKNSYAARTTGDRNVGVVGVAFFAERGSRWTSDEIRRRETADPFPSDTRYAVPPRM